MNVRSEIVALGLVGLMYSGCYNSNRGSHTSSEVENILFERPEGCVDVVGNVRLGMFGNHPTYQLVCLDKDRKLILYHRRSGDKDWSIFIQER